VKLNDENKQQSTEELTGRLPPDEKAIPRTSACAVEGEGMNDKLAYGLVEARSGGGYVRCELKCRK
jgi:hypothetical protein